MLDRFRLLALFLLLCEDQQQLKLKEFLLLVQLRLGMRRPLTCTGNAACARSATRAPIWPVEHAVQHSQMHPFGTILLKQKLFLEVH